MSFFKKIYTVCYRITLHNNHIRHSTLDLVSELKNRPVTYSEYTEGHFKALEKWKFRFFYAKEVARNID